MAKKIIDTSRLRVTEENQDKVTLDRFKRADSILTKKQKSSVVRDTFSMPPDDYALIEEIRTAAAKEGRISTKSEVVRAGLQVLSLLKGHELVDALNRLEKIYPGRKS